MSKSEAKKRMLVRYGKMGTLGWFEHEESHIPKTKSYAVIKTDRGLELGEVVGPYNYRGGNFSCSCEKVRHYYCDEFEDREAKDERDCPVVEKGGTFVRFGTKDDIMEAEHLEVSAKKELAFCQKLVKEMGLPMKMVDGEHLLGGERIILYFSSPGRVDFRELVKRLAKEYQTRIELRQIGSRDEAKLLSDFETCGQECCCKRFLKILEPVNMRMAKLQKATLDPSKISGHCGRLKCCLRYEDFTYKQLKKRLPKRNTIVTTPEGKEGKVIDVNILTQLVVVQDQSGDRVAWPVDELDFAGKKKDQVNKGRDDGGDDDDDDDDDDIDSAYLIDDEQLAKLEDREGEPSKGGGDNKGNGGKGNKDGKRGRGNNRGGKGRGGNREGGRGNRSKGRGKNRGNKGGGNRDNRGKGGDNRNNKGNDKGNQGKDNRKD